MNPKKMPDVTAPGDETKDSRQFIKTNPGRNPKIEFDRLLPHDEEAELAVLAACIAGESQADATVLERAREIICPGDFYRRAGGRVFGRMLQFRDAGRPFTLSALEASFESDLDFPKYQDLFDSLEPVTAQTAGHFAKIILENSLRRALIAATCHAHEKFFDLAVSVLEIIGKLQTAINREKSRLRHAPR